MGKLYDAMREWTAEVGEEAARLIRNGIPPDDAIEMARNNVSARRKKEKAAAIAIKKVFGGMERPA